MKNFISIICTGSLLIMMGWAQGGRHSEKFEQLDFELRSPNNYRNASGAPGHEYWQNEADYEIAITLDDENQRISGSETITYHNNSPDPLNYVWVQLDQNRRAKDSDTYKTQPGSIGEYMFGNSLKNVLNPTFEGGFNLEAVTDEVENPVSHTVNRTMMVVDLPKPLKTGESFSFKIKWWYNINDRLKIGGRSGYEYFEDDDNYLYTIAQFFPRMCVYNDYDGWQHKQFLGGGEFSLPFGKYKVSITVPSDHILGATGRLMNPEEVLTEEQLQRLSLAEVSNEPIMIVTEEEARKAEGTRATDTKTWVFEADSVRDFAFATSRKFIWDAMGVNLEGKSEPVMAMSYYPKEGNPLWEEYSTRVVAQTLKTYSHFTFPYPYHKAISVHAKSIGMEYPMICFNFGRPNRDGSYSEGVKNSMIMVIIHEIGHNYFPMIVNSDERQWTWMDEGINSFLQFLTEKAWDKNYPSRGGPPELIVPYMKREKSKLSPIMTNSEQVQSPGPNAYDKPATALNILRETVMGRELFDRAFKEYSRRWMFKHPTPTDFFRSMEDASAVDLDWFWRGWFYGVDHVDIALTEVEHYKLDNNMSRASIQTPAIELEDEIAANKKGEKKKREKKGKEEVETTKSIETPMEDPTKTFKTFRAILDEDQKKTLTDNTRFYQLRLRNVGGLVMPVILKFEFTDGTSEVFRIPAEIWRKNDQEVTKVIPVEKEVSQIILDPFKETADTDENNNFWPTKEVQSRFERFKRTQVPQGEE